MVIFDFNPYSDNIRSMAKRIPRVALVGRANVGKSTLFNRLADSHFEAIVSPIAGTTRDRKFGIVEWNNKTFELVDTGGLDVIHDDAVEKQIYKQTELAIADSDLVLFVVDIKSGEPMPQDKIAAKLIKKSGKPFIVVVNKVDNIRHQVNGNNFYQLAGKSQLFFVSGVTGIGTGDLLDEVVNLLKTVKLVPSKAATPEIKLAVIGKPNIGKSSLINGLVGYERMIISPEPYTTRDAQPVLITYHNTHIELIDTAGIRRSSRKEKLEKISVFQSKEAVEKADITWLVVDVTEPLSFQDARLGELLINAKSSVIIVANKWDAVENKDSNTIEQIRAKFYKFFPHLSFAPIIFCSAKNNLRLQELLKLTLNVFKARYTHIGSSELERFLEEVKSKQPPAKGKGVLRPKLFALIQKDAQPPRFELIKDAKSDLHTSYVRFLTNQLRAKYNFLGTPISIGMRKLTRARRR